MNKEKNNNYIENKSFLPFIVSTALVLFVLLSLVSTNQWDNMRIVVVSLLVWIAWLCYFIFEKMKSRHIADDKMSRVVKISISIMISFFFAYTIWFSGYLTLDPHGILQDGHSHQDTLFLSTVAESIKNYRYPSILINNAEYLYYHHGSNHILSGLSDLLGISVFNIYNFIYPIVCLPLYVYLIITVIIELRKYKGKNTHISAIDYVVIWVFLAGTFPTTLLDNLGIWKSSWIGSESYLFSMIFLLIYAYILLKIIKLKNKHYELYIFLLTSLFIFLCSSMKISVGFTLTICVCYITLRLKTQKLWFWLANLIYIAVFLFSYKLFSGIGEEAYSGIDIQLFSFVRNYTFARGNILRFVLAAPLHYAALLFFALIFLFYRYNAIRIRFVDAVKHKETAVDEMLIVAAVLCQMPGMFIKIAGGSAAYFSYTQEIIAVCLLIGYNIPIELQRWIQAKSVKYKIISTVCVCFIMVFLCINFRVPVYSRFKNYFISTISNERNNIADNNFLLNLYDISSIPKNEKHKYCIFINDDAELWDIYTNIRAAVFLYPALTGIRVLNGVYTDGNNIIASNGAILQRIDESLYGINNSLVSIDSNGKSALLHKLTFDEAVEQAREKGFNYIIYFFENKYHVINLYTNVY